MTRAAMVWSDSMGMHTRTLDRGREHLLGRADIAMVRLRSNLVSRRQAVVRYYDSAFRIEQVGSSNPTLVNGIQVTEPILLRDRAVIDVANHQLTFHDLNQTGRSVARSRCGNCPRLVRTYSAACPSCGTSLDCGSSITRVFVPVACRLAGSHGTVHDLCLGDMLTVTGAGELVRAAKLDAESPVVVTAEPGGPALRVQQMPPLVTLNGAPPPAWRRLKTGDVLQVHDERFVLIAR